MFAYELTSALFWELREPIVLPYFNLSGLVSISVA